MSEYEQMRDQESGPAGQAWRIEDLEARMPKPPQRTEIRPELREFLYRYAERKATGTLTEEDEATADALKAEAKRRHDAGLIGGGGGS